MTVPSGKNHHLNLLCSHITEKTGIGFDERKRRQLEETVENRCRILGFSHMGEYLERLLKPSEKLDEFRTLMDILTIRESFFFRQEAQFHAFRHFCLPLLMDKRKTEHKKINIWSAGCAGGEEAYSIAMVIRGLVPENPREEFYIKGTDISRQALRKAEEGIYTERAVRGLAAHYLNRYFTKQRGRYVLSADIRAMVDFEYFNLSENPFPFDAMPRWDIIFCRNVIIYFTTKHSRKLMGNFFSAMAEGGFLFAGFSETMRYLNDDFIPIQLGNTFIYQKPFSGQAPEPSKIFSTKTQEKPILHPKRKTGRHFPKKRLKTEKTRPAPRIKEGTNGKTSPGEGFGSARELADKGDPVGAVALLDKIIAENPLHTRAYFLLAMIHHNAGNLDQCERYLKKVIYLEPENPLAHLHLADIFKAQARKTDAVREYTNVISLLENRKKPAGDLLDDGFTGETILAGRPCPFENIGNRYPLRDGVADASFKCGLPENKAIRTPRNCSLCWPGTIHPVPASPGA